MSVRTLSDIFIPGAPRIAERLRTLAVDGPLVVAPGAIVVAHFGFFNSGGASATGIRARFALPDGLTYVAGSARIDDAPFVRESDTEPAIVGRTGAPIGDVEPGTERRISIAYKVAPIIEDGVELEIQAAIASHETDVIGSNVVRLLVRSTPQLANAGTSLRLSAAAGAEPRRELLVRATIANTGQSSAHEVVLIMPVPELTTYVPKSARLDGRPLEAGLQAPFEAARSTVISDVLAPGAIMTADYLVTVDSPLDDGTVICANASVSSREVAEFDLDEAQIAIASAPSFDGDGTRFTIESDEDVAPGTRLRMALRALNVGTSSARVLTAVIELPQGMVYSRGSATVDGMPLAESMFDGKKFVFETLPPERASELAFDAVVMAPATHGAKLPIVAKLQCSGAERSFERVLTVKAEPRFARLKNLIERPGRHTVNPDAEVTFNARLLNEGTAAATDARLRLRIDPQLSFVHAEENGTPLVTNGPLIELNSLEPHVEREIRITARVRSPIADRSRVDLGASLSSRQTAEIDLGVASYQVRSRARFSVETSRLELRSAGPLRSKEPAELHIALHNEGTDLAREVRLRIAHPPEVTLTTANGAEIAGGVLTLSDIAAGNVAEAVVRVNLTSIVPRGHVVVVEGWLSAHGYPPLHLRPVEIATRAAAEFAEAAAFETTPSETVAAGGSLSFTLMLRNTGDGIADRLVVSSRGPKRTVYVPNSTTINGVKIADENGTSPLWGTTGLVLSEVAPKIDIAIRWETVVTSPLVSGTLIEARAELEWEDRQWSLAAAPLVVRSSPRFAATPGGTTISVARLAAEAREPRALAPAPPLEAQAAQASSETSAIDASQTAPARAEAPVDVVSGEVDRRSSVGVVSEDTAVRSVPVFEAPPSFTERPSLVEPPLFTEPPSFTESPSLAQAESSAAEQAAEASPPVSQPPPEPVRRSEPLLETDARVAAERREIDEATRERVARLRAAFRKMSAPELEVTPPPVDADVKTVMPKALTQDTLPIVSVQQDLSEVSKREASGFSQRDTSDESQRGASDVSQRDSSDLSQRDASGNSKQDTPVFSHHDTPAVSNYDAAVTSNLDAPAGMRNVTPDGASSLNAATEQPAPAAPKIKPSLSELIKAAKAQAAASAAPEKPAPEPKPVITEPVPVAKIPEPVIVEPAPVAKAPEPVIVEPAPVATKAPEPVIVEPAPVATKAPEPVVVEPAPVATKAPEPVVVEPAPVTKAPEPVAKIPEPEKIVDEPPRLRIARERADETAFERAARQLDELSARQTRVPRPILPVEATPEPVAARRVESDSAPPAAPIVTMEITAARLKRTITYIENCESGKLITHLFALEAFLPDKLIGSPELDAKFASVREGFRTTLDRLFVRLRLPRFMVTAKDLETRQSRDALAELAAGATAARPQSAPSLGSGESVRLLGPIDLETLGALERQLPDAPLGGVEPWIALAALLGTTVESPAGTSGALGVFRSQFIEAFKNFRQVSAADFHRVLTTGTNTKLDVALQEVLGALRLPSEALR